MTKPQNHNNNCRFLPTSEDGGFHGNSFCEDARRVSHGIRRWLGSDDQEALTRRKEYVVDQFRIS